MSHIARQVWCDEHEKWGFTKNYAKAVRRRMSDPDLQIYRCKGRFHVGHALGPSDETQKRRKKLDNRDQRQAVRPNDGRPGRTGN